MARYSDKNGKDKPVDKSGPVGEGYDARFRGYINLSLSDDQKRAFDQWWGSGSPWEAFEAFVGDGVNVSVKIDPKSGGFIASATQRREGSPNAGLVVTARAREAGLAFGRVLYCLTILSHKESWEATQPVADPDRW